MPARGKGEHLILLDVGIHSASGHSANHGSEILKKKIPESSKKVKLEFATLPSTMYIIFMLYLQLFIQN